MSIQEILTEQGRSGQKRYNGIFFEEFLPKLQGASGVETYTEMSENDETVGALLFAIETLLEQAEWDIQPSGDEDIDRECAEFIKSCMDDMEHGWSDTMSEIFSYLTYGWSVHEIVYKIRGGNSENPQMYSKYDDRLIGWRKLPIRSQDTLLRWEYKDGTDDLVGFTQQPPPDHELITIPYDKLLHFRTKSRKNNPEGRSILRTAYRSYYFKRRIQEIEGIGIERDLAGLPVISFTSPDVEVDEKAVGQYQRIVSSVRRDAVEGLVLPYGVELKLLTSGGGRQFDTNGIIKRFNNGMLTSVMADFLILGQNDTGSYALSSDKTRIFAMAIATYLKIIADEFNKKAIPQLIRLNGEHFKNITDFPKLVHGDIEDISIEKFSEAVNRLLPTGVLVPDIHIENKARKLLGLPEVTDDRDYPEVQVEQDNSNDTSPAPKNPEKEDDGDE